MSLEFTLVRRAISLAVIDGPDTGDNPDILKAQGSVLFEPVIKKGDSIQVQTRGGSETYALAPIECPINDGIISHRGQDGVKLPAGGEAANPSLIRWKATFSRMQAGGKSFTLAPVIFDAVPGGEIDLTMVAPVAGAPEGVVRGPRGTSLESIIVDGSELVFTAVDDAGSFEIARIPLDEMVRAEAEAAADGVRDALAVDVAASQSARDAAEGHANRAATSETNAAASESAAKQSETNAGDYAAVATTAATEAVDAMSSVSDIIGANYATHEYVDSKNWVKRDFASGEDLNEVTDPGLYTMRTYALANSLLNKPTGLNVVDRGVTEVLAGGGAAQQTWYPMGIASKGDMPVMRRRRDDGGTWTEWERVPGAKLLESASWFKGTIPLDANLDSYQTPGEFEIPSYTVARSLTGRPDDLLQRGTLKVRVAGGTVMQEITEWTPTGDRVWKRETAGGVFRTWRDTTAPSVPDEANTPLQTVYVWGDSAVAGGDRNGGWAAGENLPGRIGALLDTPVESRGVSGHTANTTLIRAGVLEIWATGTIPSDTSEVAISVAGLDIDLRVRRTFAATWDGIAGTLAIDGDNFTFKRAAAGTAQTISTPKRVILNTEVPLGEGTHIFLMGGNDWLSDAGTAPEANKEIHLVESYRRAVEAVPGDPLKKVLIGGLKTRRSTVVGDENYRIVRAVNQQLRKMFPGIFVDRQAWLASRGLAAAGIIPTPADNEAMAAGLVPPSAFASGDDTHIRKEVVQAEAAELWGNALVRKGWARLKSGVSLPPQVDTLAGDLSASLPPAFSSAGSPEGKVTAPVGSVYTDTAATNGAIRWIKASGTGSTGWRVEYGDTGWRDITSTFDPPLQSGTVRIRKTPAEVQLLFYYAQATDGAVSTLSSSFGSGASTHFPLYSAGGANSGVALSHYSGRLTIQRTSAQVNGVITIPSATAWPATLPGTPL